MELFTYGTLMDADIVAALLGRTPPFRPGVLTGYARHPVRNACYPGLVRSVDARTEGRVYRGLNAEDWSILDEFEDVLYARQAAEVELDGGQRVTAQVYVVPPENRSFLDLDRPWCFEDFKRREYPAYLLMCQSSSRQDVQPQQTGL